MSRNKLYSSVAFRVLVGLATMGLLTGCLNPTTQLKSGAQAQALTSVVPGGTKPGDVVPAAGANFSWSAAPAKVITNLGTAKVVSMNLMGTSNFSGTVSLSLDKSEIHDIDPGNYVAITLSPSTVNLTPGGSVAVTASIVVDTMAPDFDLHFHVIAQQIVGGLPVVANQTVLFQVMPLYEMGMLGGAPIPEKWVGPALLNFRAHKPGVTVNYLNYDSAAQHIVHSSGAIPHQNVATPLVQAVAGVPQTGGTYSATVLAGASQSSSYYCHIHETAAQTRTMNFNVGAASNTFTAVNAILQAKCVSCHTAANAQGGVRYDSYAQALNTVVSKNPPASRLFGSVNADTMPIGSALLTTAQKLTIMDWINAGAINN